VQLENASKQIASRVCHRSHQEAAIQELIAPFAAGLGDEKASMASGTEQMAVLNGAAGIVIGADGVIGAYFEAFEGSIENAGEAFGAGD
jgi:hypothetical protein